MSRSTGIENCDKLELPPPSCGAHSRFAPKFGCVGLKSYVGPCSLELGGKLQPKENANCPPLTGDALKPVVAEAQLRGIFCTEVALCSSGAQ
jgi:hypothetical protein